MKRKKTRSVASYRAASLKGARTRKRMKLSAEAPLTDFLMPMPEYVVYENETKHALPNPWFDMVRK